MAESTRERRRPTWFSNSVGVWRSPYTRLDPEFRGEFSKVRSSSVLMELKMYLEKRYGMRANSIGTVVVLLSVVVTAILVFYGDTLDTITSVEKQARWMYLPGLWVEVLAATYFTAAIKASRDEVRPKVQYAGDELQQAFHAVMGCSIQEYLAREQVAPRTGVIAWLLSLIGRLTGETQRRIQAEQELLQLKVLLAQLTETASRTSHDRDALNKRRFYMNRGLSCMLIAVYLVAIATTLYALGVV